LKVDRYPKYFRPHGISSSMNKGKLRLYVISHTNLDDKKNTIEIFELTNEKNFSWTYIGELANEKLSHPNDLFALPEERLLISNDGDGVNAVLFFINFLFKRATAEITYYENKGNPREPIWQLNDTLFAGIEVKQSAHPGFADLDGDGRLDMVIGEYDGNFTYYKNLFAVVTDVKETNNSVPKNFSLEQNYPNPFNPSTTIEFKVAEPGYVSIKIFDALGREVAALVNEFMQPGNYKTSFNTSSFSQRITSGIYFYRLETPSFTQTKKMILLK